MYRMRRLATSDAVGSGTTGTSSTTSIASIASTKRIRLGSCCLLEIDHDAYLDEIACAGWALKTLDRSDIGTHSMRKHSNAYYNVSGASIRMRHFRQTETDHTDSESDTDNEDEHTTRRFPDLVIIT